MIRSLSVALATIALTGCVSVLPEQDVPDGLYRFGAPQTTRSLQATVAVREPEASRLFGGRAIAAEDNAGALRLVRGVEWADSATRLMQVALLDSLDEGKGVAVPFESGVAADYELTWRIGDFTLNGTTARCRVEATLVDAGSRRVVAQTNVTSSTSAQADTSASRALALADAGRDCVDGISAFLSDKAVAPEEEKPAELSGE